MNSAETAFFDIAPIELANAVQKSESDFAKIDERSPFAAPKPKLNLYNPTELEEREAKDKKKENFAVRSARKVLKNRFFLFVIVLANIYSIFVSPSYSILMPKAIDPLFDAFCLITILIFVFEMAMQLISVFGYFFGFYFFVDFLSVSLLVFDLTFVFYPLFYSNGKGVRFAVGLRVLRVIRVLRLVRLIKLAARYRIGLSAFRSRDAPKRTEAKITKILKESNVRKLVVLILVILLATPLFDSSLYLDVTQEDLSFKAGFVLWRLLLRGASFSVAVAELRALFAANATQLIFLRVNGYVWDAGVVASLRPNEWNQFATTLTADGIAYDFEIITSVQYRAQITAMLLLFNAMLVTGLMVFSIYGLNRDMSDLVLDPLERMIKKVRELSLDPARAIEVSEGAKEKAKNTNETLLVEAAISKLARLLLLGFGEAGCRVISYYLTEKNSQLDDKIPGTKMRAVFGFCDIHHFAEANEALLEDVTTFVNSIAEVVHGCVHAFHGTANKNIGDAFLLVWRLHEDEAVYNLIRTERGPKARISAEEVARRTDEFNAVIAEMALLAFVKIIIELQVQPAITRYASEPALLARVPGFSVKMGFGLHEGWAIEGAIGSQYKIDASYLSPNVNLASRLEAASKQFNTEILFSHSIFALFKTSELRNLCRHIDTVTVKGSQLPLQLYTVDINLSEIKGKAKGFRPSERVEQFSKVVKDLSTNIIARNFKAEETEKLRRTRSLHDESETGKMLKRPDFAAAFNFAQIDMKVFRSVFKSAVERYLLGEWQEARGLLENCLTIKPGDGPATVLYNYIRGLNYSCPPFWKNCRELLNK